MSFVAAQDRQSFVRDVVGNFQSVVMYCSRSQYSHIRGVSGVSTSMTGHRHIVATRVYRSYCCVVAGRRLAKKCWLDEMFRVRENLYSRYVRGIYGLSSSGFPFICHVFNICVYFNLRSSMRELTSYAGCYLIVVSITLVVIIPIRVSGIYVYRDSDSRRRGRDISPRLT